jgi:acyl-CoA reductase-like NAD-dependent aldehyde dehydrogenase
MLLELGSNSPVIVDETADLDHAAERVAATAFANAGQSCISAQRLYVQESVAQEFTGRLVKLTERLVTGDPLDEDTDVGPLIRPGERDRVLEWIGEATRDGATVRTGGSANPDGTLPPTVIDGVRPHMRVSCEEVFGPVLAVQTVRDLDEAIALSNDSRYGLHAGIFTTNLANALRASRELVFGGVTVNESPTFRLDQQPYGGVRESGNTREGPAWAIHDYLDETAVLIQLPQESRS